MTEIEYSIGTGGKSDFYTLWKTTRVDLRPRDESGAITQDYKRNALGGNMYYHVHITFVQNLGKTKETAIAKAHELGIDISPEEFDFSLQHRVKPSFEAFGVSLKFRKDKWFAKATPAFFESWKAHKDEMKEIGWSCWKQSNTWYMCIRTGEE